jgi:hypothetical protein
MGSCISKTKSFLALIVSNLRDSQLPINSRCYHLASYAKVSGSLAVGGRKFAKTIKRDLTSICQLGLGSIHCYLFVKHTSHILREDFQQIHKQILFRHTTVGTTLRLSEQLLLGSNNNSASYMSNPATISSTWIHCSASPDLYGTRRKGCFMRM